jgi:ribosomal protein S18 acetylase RimI-like enzyme
MVTKIETSVRPALLSDKSRIANLIHFEVRVHRNLDWKSPLDWIGIDPFLVLEKNHRIYAALACPPDPPDIAWVRLFAVHGSMSEIEAWRNLWSETYLELAGIGGVKTAAVLPMHGWFRELLEKEGFQNSHNVVMLDWDGISIPPARPQGDYLIRPLNFDDLVAVEQVDREAFLPLWRNSLDSLLIAFQQASFAMVAEHEGEIVGYQISTATSMGGHLARLAVLPAFQRQGVGYLLLRDVLARFKNRGTTKVTVNTQGENEASLHLYQSAGFRPTGEVFPVYEIDILK